MLVIYAKQATKSTLTKLARRFFVMSIIVNLAQEPIALSVSLAISYLMVHVSQYVRTAPTVSPLGSVLAVVLIISSTPLHLTATLTAALASEASALPALIFCTVLAAKLDMYPCITGQSA
jgi:hypothetical protein